MFAVESLNGDIYNFVFIVISVKIDHLFDQEIAITQLRCSTIYHGLLQMVDLHLFRVRENQ